MAITQTQSFTGRGGRITINGVFIPITKWTAKQHKEFVVSTDSNNLDVDGSGQLFRSRAPGEIWIEFSLEANYDFGGTTDSNFSKNWLHDGPWPVVLGFTPTTTYASFNADFDEMPGNLTVTVPGAAMITFSASGQSNGVVTIS